MSFYKRLLLTAVMLAVTGLVLDGVSFESNLDWLWVTLVVSLIQNLFLPPVMMMLRNRAGAVIFLGMMGVQAAALALADWIVGGFTIDGLVTWLLCWLIVGTVCTLPLLRKYLRIRT